MELILREDVSNLGRRGEVVNVSDGYGRNFLLPQKLAMEATAANKVVIDQMKQSAVRRSAKEKSEAELLVTQLNNVELQFERKVGENDHLFGSVTAADIVHQPQHGLGGFALHGKVGVARTTSVGIGRPAPHQHTTDRRPIKHLHPIGKHLGL